MIEPTEIEKKSLEAHVELCAERYNSLEIHLETVETKMTVLATMIQQVRDMMIEMSEKRNEQLITWGVAIIGGLLATVAWLLSHYLIR